MTQVRSALDTYLDRRAVTGPWRLEGDTEGPFSGAVVIPALAESARLSETLESLAANPLEALARWQIVVVVNNSARASEEQKADNLLTLARLRREAEQGSVRLAWIDAASPGREVPARTAGAGSARRIGFDLALAGLQASHRPLLVALDADTLVDASYLPAIEAHFARRDTGGAVLPLWHQREGSAEARQAIETYELYLRAYPLGLQLAGSPYAYLTVGSAMACTADAYVRAGGMNRRRAGEDFYFLQQLAKTSGVAQVSGTVVRPSARTSSRTPFGTGPSMARLLSGDGPDLPFFDPRIFEILRCWLKLACSHPERDTSVLLEKAEEIHPEMAAFLEGAGFESAWSAMQRNGRGLVSPGGFHGWFDGLKTFRLVRHLSQKAYPPGEPVSMVTPLMAAAGRAAGQEIAELNDQIFAFWE
ncbi:MAG: glycosyltransferase [Desulfuromonadales bacterium]